MLVTDAGRLIRVPGDQVRLTGRQAMGVRLFRLNDTEQVTAVFPILDGSADDVAVEDAAPEDGTETGGAGPDA